METREILQDIISDFEAGKFVRFFRDKNAKFAPKQENLSLYNDDNFKDGKKLGEVTFTEDDRLAVIVFQASQPLSERSGKKAQYEKGKKILKDRQYDAGIFIFYDTQGNFRFSLIYANYLGNRRDWSVFRRFTYFVSQEFTNKTFLQRIGGGDFSSLEQIKDAFSVEKVTKEFYQDIANWYFWARECPGVFFPKNVENEEQRALFLIRLLTRLIFCWFLREKRNPQTSSGLIPKSLFDVRHIKDLLKDASPEACTYYTAILQNLFFATLNTEMDAAQGATSKPGEPPNRRFIKEGDSQRSDDHMIHTVWRHARQLQDPEAIANLLRDIPFLNGGLFECLDDRVQKGNSPYTEEVRIDGFATDLKKQPKLPNFLFFGQEKVVDLSSVYRDNSHSHETFRPLLSILQSYNFTLDENTPLEQEVALDPELLGHVFENLLAAFNQETGTAARKATGSFYTPRVVVDWMVDQALLVYLKEKLTTNGTDKKLKRLLSWEYEGHEFNLAEVEKLIDAIDQLKVIDPACGSGAFPMGMLQKLVHVLKKLDPENKGWRKRQEIAAAKIESGPAREAALKAIQRAFASDNDDYGRKLYLIEKCLYGVDIQPIAVQIAKLRFFISLVVDQAIDPKEENYGILPLPNLETKVVAANTLLGLQRGQLLLGSDNVRQLEKQLQQVRHDYFTARRYKDKKVLRARDKELCVELAKALTESGECSVYDAERLATWNPYDTNTHAPFFDPGWMFGLASKNNDGVFNIVIGNPPYVRQEELKDQTVTGSDGKQQALKDALNGQYECFTGTADLYVYFFERSLQLLHTGGVLSFITSNKYFRAGYGEQLRTYLMWATKPTSLLDFGEAPVFTAIVEPAILVTQKTRNVEHKTLPSPRGPMGILHPDKLPPADWQSRVMTWIPGPDIHEFPDIFERNAIALSQRDLKPDGWRLESPVKLRLLERLRKAGTPLGEYVKGQVYYGIKTGLNEAFVVNRATRDRLIAEHPSSKEILKPFLRGRDVKRWRCEPKDLWLIFTRRGIEIKQYPAIQEHLKKFKKKLEKRAGEQQWYELQASPANTERFEQPKVIYQEINRTDAFAYDDGGFYLNNKLFMLPGQGPFLLGILCSSVLHWYIRTSAGEKEGGFLGMQWPFMKQLPIPSATPQQQSELEKIAVKIIAAKKADPAADVSALESEIDQMVYKLYSLTEEEIKIVEGT